MCNSLICFFFINQLVNNCFSEFHSVDDQFCFTLIPTTSLKYGNIQSNKSQQITQEHLINVLWEICAAQV